MLPDARVLEIIGLQYTTRMQFAATSVDAALELYTMVKETPTAVTKTIIENELNLHINGPMKDSQSNILAASDAHGSFIYY